jgi:hypothetical protein
MNLVGKIFTALIFVMCIVFASFALMLHAAHKNWYNEAAKKGGYRDQVDQLAKEKADLEQAYALLGDERKKDNERNRGTIKTLEQANSDLNQLVNDPLHGLNHQVQEAQAALQKVVVDFRVVQRNLADLRDETDAVRGENARVSADQQKTFDRLQQATTELNTLGLEIAQYQRRLAAIVEPYTRGKQLLAWAGIRESDMNKEPPDHLSGIVTAVLPSEVEISVGSDDGVHVGHRFAVTRPSTGHYIGDVVVYEVNYPNRAVCRPDKATMRDQIQKYDHVQASLTKAKTQTR